ncbi:MAG: DUF3617 domain-containing protein [Rhizobacter sp.]|nr:DUF3617 domain-containing protein [Rhizobacter sp.]
MKTPLTLCLAAAVFGASAGTQAQTSPHGGPKIEAGLWEISIALKSQSGKAEVAMKEAQAYIARLPPEQRKQVEDMMAAQGMQLGDKTSTVKACISKEDAERGEIPQQAGECTQQVLDRSPSAMRVKFSCSTNPPASGEATVNFQSATAYTSTALVDTVVMGQPERVNVDQTGRWLGADCGSVRALGK